MKGSFKSMKYDVLIIDDEKVLADSTAEYFNMFGVTASVVYSANECRDFFSSNSASLLLLDINLGDGSGFELCKELRSNFDIPILFISARSSDDDKIIALNIGGDDYIEKPCSLSVLLAKVKVVLKRYAKDASSEYKSGRITINFNAKQLYVEDEPVKLTALEFRLLCYLCENRGRVLSKQELFDKVWQDRFTGDGTLNVHIRHLREAIETDPNNPQYILTVWGEGYKFEG